MDRTTVVRICQDGIIIFLSLGDTITGIFVILQYYRLDYIYLFIFSLLVLCISQLVNCGLLFAWTDYDEFSKLSTLNKVLLYVLCLPISSLIHSILLSIKNVENDTSQTTTGDDQMETITDSDIYLERYLPFKIQACVNSLIQSIIQMIGIIVIFRNNNNNDNDNIIFIISLLISIINVVIHSQSICFHYVFPNDTFISLKVILFVCGILDYLGIFLTLLYLFYHENIDDFGRFV